MDLESVIVPVATGILAFVGSWAGVRTEIAWIKRELQRHDRELAILRRERA